MIIAYDKDCGRILHTINPPLRADVEKFYREQTDTPVLISKRNLDAEQVVKRLYVKDKRLCARPTFAVPTDQIELAIGEVLEIKDLPVGCNVSIDGQTFVCDDGKLVLSADSPDQFEVALESWPFVPANFVVTVRDEK